MTTKIQGDLILEADYKIEDNLIVYGDIKGKDGIIYNINCGIINCRNINCLNINCRDIDCLDIDYYAVCFAYNNINCKSIKGKINNCKHFVLDGEIIINKDKKMKEWK